MLRRLGDSPPSDSPIPESSPPHLPLWLLVWIALQLAALTVGALQMPLSARYPVPAERLALHVMLVVQVSSAALLFPSLMRTWGMSVMAIAVSWPFVQLAGHLSGHSAGVVVASAVYLSGWLGVLAAWRGMLRSERAQLAGAAVAVTLSLGGALLWYLRVEFTSAVDGSGLARWSMLGPVTGVLSIVIEGAARWEPWLFLLSFFVVTCVTIAVIRLRQFIH
jgi:hypothetical protein